MTLDEQRALLVAFLEQYDPTRDGSNEDAIDAFLAARPELRPALGMSPYAPPDPTAPATEPPKECKMSARQARRMGPPSVPRRFWRVLRAELPGWVGYHAIQWSESSSTVNVGDLGVWHWASAYEPCNDARVRAHAAAEADGRASGLLEWGP
jgi:hypothetical protein